MKKKLYKIKYKATITCECFVFAKNEEDVSTAFYYRPADRSISTELERNEVVIHTREIKQ